jgi:protocatechuate 3,4-dioxygenase beta subunit
VRHHDRRRGTRAATLLSLITAFALVFGGAAVPALAATESDPTPVVEPAGGTTVAAASSDDGAGAAAVAPPGEAGEQAPAPEAPEAPAESELAEAPAADPTPTPTPLDEAAPAAERAHGDGPAGEAEEAAPAETTLPRAASPEPVRSDAPSPERDSTPRAATSPEVEKAMNAEAPDWCTTEQATGPHSISGTVRDDAGTPIAGAIVEGWEPSEYGPNATSCVVTGADGAFRLPGVTAAGWHVYVSFPQGSGYLSTYYGGSWENRELIAVDGDVTGTDIVALRGASLSGTIAEADRERISWLSWSGEGDRSGSVEYDPETGAFTASQVWPGAVQLTANLGSGWQEDLGAPVELAPGDAYAYPEPLTLPGLAQLTVVNRSDEDVDVEVYAADSAEATGYAYLATGDSEILEFRAGTEVVLLLSTWNEATWDYDRVWWPDATSREDADVLSLSADEPQIVTFGGGDGSISGVVTDASGAPLEGATVSLYRASDQRNALRTTTTTADGSYEFGYLNPNNYAVAVEVTEPFGVQTWYGGDGTREEAVAIGLDEGESFTAGDIAQILGGAVRGSFDVPDGLSINHRMQQPDHPTAVGVSGPDYAAVRAALRSASRAFQV